VVLSSRVVRGWNGRVTCAIKGATRRATPPSGITPTGARWDSGWFQGHSRWRRRQPDSIMAAVDEHRKDHEDQAPAATGVSTQEPPPAAPRARGPKQLIRR